MTTHELKTVQPYFDAVVKGRKTFEIRKDDRGGYRVGDLLILREWDGEDYPGPAIDAEVIYVTDYEQQPGYVVMAIRLISYVYHMEQDAA